MTPGSGYHRAMERRTEIAVVGGGIMGAAAAWQLSRRGRRVTLFEQFTLNHQRGSSHGAARIFRFAYDIPDYVRLAQASLPLWREVEAATGQEILRIMGGLDFGAPDTLEALASTLSDADVPYERLSAAAVAARYPAFRLEPGWEGIVQPQGGILNADRCRLGLIEIARQTGTEVLAETRVTALEPDGGVTMRTDRGDWRAEQVVLAAAGWSDELLAPLGLTIPLTVTREHVAYYRLDGDIIPFILHPEPGRFHFYGLPNWDEDLKAGINLAGPETDPRQVGVVEQARIREIDDLVARYIPGADSHSLRAETCLYASTPDDDFVLDRVGPIVLGIGFGGHGFKFGAMIGTLLADLVEGKTIPAAERFSATRFR